MPRFVEHGALTATLRVCHSKPMNTLWFKGQLKDKHLSQRGLAKLLSLDNSAVSLMLRGKRRMTLQEAHRIAEILGVATTEVMREAGIAVEDDIRRVPVAAVADGEGGIKLLAARTHDKVTAPADVPSDAYAVQVRSPGNPKDGWVFYVSAGQQDPRERIDTLCLVAMHDGSQTLAYVRRGYRKDTFNLIALTDHGKLMQDSIVSWVSPVLWIRP